jgi:hypothetical protein
MNRRVISKLVVRDFLINASLAIVGEVVLRYLLPNFWFPFFPLIPVFFFIMGMLVFVTLYYYVQIKGDAHIVITYMTVRFYKMLMTLLLIWLYAANFHDHMMSFAICIMLVYLANLIYETSAMTMYVKKGMKNK